MFYRTRPEKKEELMGGRTVSYMAKVCECSRVHLSYVLTGYPKRRGTREFVENIIIKMATESVQVKEKLEKLGMDKTIEYFFEEV